MKTIASLLTVSSLLFKLRADDITKENDQFQEPEPAVPSLPNWEPYSKISKDSFFEQFDKSWNKRWVVSEAVKKKPEDSKDDDDLFRYTGKWAVEEPSIYKVTEGDMGLVVKDPARHHAISSVFKKPIDNKDKPLIVQYEVKLQNGLECGGAYLKLLTYQKDFVAKKFDDKTPYTIMFGPDKCGSTNKVHFIFRHENPLNHTITEKHLESPPSAKHATKLTSLYTLIVRPDNSYEIKINQESVSKGSLLENFDPTVNPPKEIEDVTDKKPSDWVEEARIADPEAVKPEDWDESQPEHIPDESAKKPSDWLDSELLEIPDPTAIKPEDWVDDEDGEWIAPEIPNPKCEKVSGCGEWIRPTIKNPAFKGKWKAPMIDNPVYKGEWKPKMIPNPDFYEDLQPSNFPKIGGIGFELWTMQNNILFDNIYVGYSEEEASETAKATWGVKFAAEEAQRAAESKKHSPPEGIEPPSSEYIEYAIYHIKLFLKLARNDFIGTIQAMPKVAGGLAGSLLVIWLLASFILNALFPAANPEPDTAAQRKKDDLPIPDAEPEEEESTKKEESSS